MNKRILIPRPSIDHHEEAFKIVEEEDEDDFSEDLPSFKSVILKPTNAQTEQNLFYDQKQSKWIELDNFAFNDNLNHFDEKSTSCEETSSLALLDSRIFDESKLEEDSIIIVNELKKHLDDANRNNESFTTEDSSQPNSLDVSFDTAAKPKIKSPKDKQTVAKSRKKSSPLRKLSNESQKLPSLKSPKTSITPEVSSAEKSKQFKRNRSKSHNYEQYQAAPVVQRKLNLDKSAKKLGQNRSHSATNLNKLSVKDYHGSFQIQSRRSSNGTLEPSKSDSCDSLYQVSLKELAGKKADYSHIQSKVRRYIYGDQKSGSTIQDDLHCKSFVLSPGRKSLSMSNLVQEIDSTTNCSRRTSIKSFLSSKNLPDDLQVQIRSRSSTLLSKSRESLLVSNDKVSRLLDHHSSEEEILQATDEIQNPELLFEVQELLEVAMNERQSKMEAKQVLAQLQSNYDELQKKFAAAEITIDKLRFCSSETTNTNVDGNVMMLESAFNEENQCFYPSETFLSCQIACQNGSTSITSSNPSLSNFYHMLTEIKEQLYGFEILSSNVSSYTSLERKATMEKLKISYTSIQNNYRIGINDATFMKLLNEVGEKLYIMDLQSKDDCTDYETFAQGITKKVSLDEIDPLEKVEKWRKDLNKPSNVPSGYGSNSTSPTPIVGCKKIVSSERSSFEERSPGDLDSGCPGSERSPSALISNVSAMTRNLSHVEETEEPPQNSQSSVVKNPDTIMTKKTSTSTAAAFHPSADFSSDEQHLSTLMTKKHNKRSQQQQQHHHYFEHFSKENKNVEMRQLHSITDLSSDEEVVFGNNNNNSVGHIQSAAAAPPLQISVSSSSAINYQQKVENEIVRLREQLEITTSANTPKKSNDSASHNSTLNMDLPNVDLNVTPRGSHVILAQQIDQEISELRNIFEDHKEEMLSVINEDRAAISTANVGCSPIIFDNPKIRSYPNSSSPRRTRIKKSIPNFSDSEDSRDVQEERRQEFERFRQMRKQKRNNSTQNQQVPPPQFAIGEPISSANISSLFPKVDDPNSGGRHVPTADGDQVFIPRLNLDDQWSIEDPQNQQHKSLELKVDKSCQTVELLRNFKFLDKKKGKYKSKDMAHLIETLKSANDIASRMKQRSEDLLNELQSEIDTITTSQS